MPYTIEQWNDHMQKVIGAMNDQATLTSLVTQASDEYTGLFATNTTLSTENEQLKQENTRLKEANLELFLRVGQQNIDKTGGSGRSTEQKTKAETITVEDLFKEVK
jgi:hypothetical protein